MDSITLLGYSFGLHVLSIIVILFLRKRTSYYRKMRNDFVYDYTTMRNAYYALLRNPRVEKVTASIECPKCHEKLSAKDLEELMEFIS